jgi:phage terminase small subunit
VATELEPKHKALVDRYLVHRNGSRAARDVGYAKAGSRVRACEILARPEVKAYLEAETAKLETESRLAAYLIREELAIIGHSDMTDYIVTKRGRVKLAPGVPAEAWRAISSIETSIDMMSGNYNVKIKLWPKDAALRMAGEHLAMYKQVVHTRDLSLEDALDELDDADDATS